MLDVSFPFPDGLYFFRVNVETDCRKARGDKSATERQADISQADNANPRLSGFEIRSEMIRQRSAPHVV